MARVGKVRPDAHGSHQPRQDCNVADCNVAVDSYVFPV